MTDHPQERSDRVEDMIWMFLVFAVHEGSPLIKPCKALSSSPKSCSLVCNKHLQCCYLLLLKQLLSESFRFLLLLQRINIYTAAIAAPATRTTVYTAAAAAAAAI